MSVRAPLRLGTRRSPLALAQARVVADALEALDEPAARRVELVEVVSDGDRSTEALTSIGGTGVFVTALRDALTSGAADFAVHSYKDLPTAAAPGLCVAAVPPREDPRDAVVARDGRTLAELPAGARIGTGSPRRAAQLRALGLGHDVVAIRGNVETRMGKVLSGELDAVVLARAGLARLGRLDAVTEVLDPLAMLPAPAQGALAVECRDPGQAPRDGSDQHELHELHDLLTRLDDPDSRATVTAERSVLAGLEAGCSAPVGAYADVAEGEHQPELYLRAVVAEIDGGRSVRMSATGPLDEAEQVGHELARRLLAEGAGELMGEQIP